jgi:hypothetical protein
VTQALHVLLNFPCFLVHSTCTFINFLNLFFFWSQRRDPRSSMTYLLPSITLFARITSRPLSNSLLSSPPLFTTSDTRGLTRGTFDEQAW